MYHKYSLFYYIIRLSFYKIEKNLKNTFWKRKKCNFGLIKSYQIISLFNYINKW